MSLEWEVSKPAKYAEKWWKKNGYAYERVGCSVYYDKYVVKKDGHSMEFDVNCMVTNFKENMVYFEKMFAEDVRAKK